MALTDKDIEQLEAYWQNTLSEESRLAMENRLETDMDFRKEADNIRLLSSGLEVMKHRQMRLYLKDIDTEMPPYNSNPPIQWVKIGLVALAIALAAFAVWYIFARPKEDTPKLSPVIVAYFLPYPALGIKRSPESADFRKEALMAYSKKSYNKAIPLFQKAFDLEKDSLLLFYQGIAYLGNGQAAQAQAVFTTLQASESVPKQAVIWYLALSYIDMGQKEKALPLLKKVADTEGGNPETLGKDNNAIKALELLATLKKQ